MYPFQPPPEFMSWKAIGIDISLLALAFAFIWDLFREPVSRNRTVKLGWGCLALLMGPLVRCQEQSPGCSSLATGYWDCSVAFSEPQETTVRYRSRKLPRLCFWRCSLQGCCWHAPFHLLGILKEIAEPCAELISGNWRMFFTSFMTPMAIFLQLPDRCRDHRPVGLR
jgi:hypothetical protein